MSYSNGEKIHRNLPLGLPGTTAHSWSMTNMTVTPHCAAQLMMQKQGNTMNTSKWKPRYTTTRAEWRPMHAFRDTYIDEKIRNTTWVPGVGSHNTFKHTITPWEFPKGRIPERNALNPSKRGFPGPGSYRQTCYTGGDNSGTRRLNRSMSATGFTFKKGY